MNSLEHKESKAEPTQLSY